MPSKKQTRSRQSDSTYFLKMVLYLLVGAQWVFIVDGALTRQVPVPLGLIAGLLFARHEHFRIDRKIEYALLLTAMFVGFWSHVGIYVTLL